MEAQASPDQNNRNKCTNCGKMIHRGSWARHFWLAIPCPDDACEARLWHHKLSDGVKHLLNRHPETFTNIEMAKETLKSTPILVCYVDLAAYIRRSSIGFTQRNMHHWILYQQWPS
jgi:hypothetical protein